MKKFLSIFLILLIGMVVLIPGKVVYSAGECDVADGVQGECPAGKVCYCDGKSGDGVKTGKCAPPGAIVICNPLEAASFEELVNNIINFVFNLALVFAPLMLIVGAFYFVTAAGDPKKIDTGKAVIMYTLIGLAIVILSKGIIAVIQEIFGG